MFLVSAAEDTANTIGKLVGSEQSLGLSNLAFAMDPLRLDGVQPRALFGQKARNYPHPSFATVGLDLAVMGGYPVAHFFTLVPGGVVPDQKQRLFARRSELVGAVAEKLRGYGTYGSAVHEPQPGFSYPRQVQPVAGQRLGLGIILARSLLEEAHRLSIARPRMQRSPLEAGEPALVLEAHNPPRMGLCQTDQPVAIPFLRAYSGSGLSIQRLARCQRSPNRSRVARMVSPLTRLSVRPCSKLTSAACSNVQKLSSTPKFLGLWCRSSFRAQAPSSSKAAWTSAGREEPFTRASSPRSSKSWMTSRTVCDPQPRERAIWEARSLRSLARMIWARRRTKASEERSAVFSCSFSLSESGRTKIGGFMAFTIPLHTNPVLEMH